VVAEPLGVLALRELEDGHVNGVLPICAAARVQSDTHLQKD